MKLSEPVRETTMTTKTPKMKSFNPCTLGLEFSMVVPNKIA